MNLVNHHALTIESATHVKAFRAPQFYVRQVLGKLIHVDPVGCPQTDRLLELAAINMESQVVNNNRQLTHTRLGGKTGSVH